MAMVWTKTIVPMDGTSKVVLGPNRKRRAFMLLNPSGNDPIAYDFTGAEVSLTTGIQMLENDWERRDGDDNTIGQITAIGTNGQNIIVWEGERR